jgi:uncharacterized protein DUF3551
MKSTLVIGGRGVAMLAAVSAFAIVAGVASSASAASAYPYCAVSRGADMSYEQCSFGSLEECQAEVVSLRGYCHPNPRYVAPVGRAWNADDGVAERPRRVRRPRD